MFLLNIVLWLLRLLPYTRKALARRDKQLREEAEINLLAFLEYETKCKHEAKRKKKELEIDAALGADWLKELTDLRHTHDHLLIRYRGSQKMLKVWESGRNPVAEASEEDHLLAREHGIVTAWLKQQEPGAEWEPGWHEAYQAVKKAAREQVRGKKPKTKPKPKKPKEAPKKEHRTPIDDLEFV